MSFVLRPLRMEDAASIAKHCNNEKLARFLTDRMPYPYTLEDAESYLSGVLSAGESRQCVRGIEVDGEAVGTVGFFQSDDIHRKCGIVGYWVAEEYWGRGIVGAALSELITHVFSHYDVVRLSAEIFSENTGSRRVLEKNGFVLEGTLRKSVFKREVIHDGLLYALVR